MASTGYDARIQALKLIQNKRTLMERLEHGIADGFELIDTDAVDYHTRWASRIDFEKAEVLKILRDHGESRHNLMTVPLLQRGSALDAGSMGRVWLVDRQMSGEGECDGEAWRARRLRGGRPGYQTFGPGQWERPRLSVFRFEKTRAVDEPAAYAVYTCLTRSWGMVRGTTIWSADVLMWLYFTSARRSRSEAASPHGAPECGTDEPNEEAPWVARAELAPWAGAVGEYATIDLTPSADDGMRSQIRATQPPRSPCSAAPLVQGARCDKRFARWEHLHKALMEHGEHCGKGFSAR
ncbi:hypothetical protein GGX14DRAFT_392971 [Mycena pura]|uniref:Uncharacterized protein n=1 Tax=Mycena pura TaxID=153505 RepID=A0AAD6YIW7_9AGAR|nr:hypothetical protein GGX14DRAFT_392971 [Mycena pura]